MDNLEYGLKETIQLACDMVAGDRIVGKSRYSPEEIAMIDAFNKANPLPPLPNSSDADPSSSSDAVNAAYERCAQLVEQGHTAHDLHELAATIRGWKESEEGSP